MNINELIKRLADTDPRSSSYDENWCHFCGIGSSEDHKPSCLWVEANTLCGNLEAIHIRLYENLEESKKRRAQEQDRDRDIDLYGPLAPNQNIKTAWEMAMDKIATSINEQIYNRAGVLSFLDWTGNRKVGDSE